MKKYFILVILVAVLLVSGAVALAMPPLNTSGPDNNKAKHVQDEIIVKFRGDEKPFRVIKVPQGKVLEEIGKYKKRADVVYAEPNYIAHTMLTPNDPLYSYQWHLDDQAANGNPYGGENGGGINVEPAWGISTGSGVTVAIVDTGITQGTDLANTCFVPGYDFVNNDTSPADDNGHGTHVAGTVAQSTDNGHGVAGVAFGSCLMPVKVLDSGGSGTYADVADGIYFAVDNGAKVINLSLGGRIFDITLKDAVKYAYEKGVTVVAAAGNDGSSAVSYPAAYDDYVIAVGATQYDESLAPYSNYGSSLDLVAPGGNTSVDQNNDGYVDGVLQQTFQRTGRSGRVTWSYYLFQGTSMAAPHVAGTAALVIANVIANGNATTPDKVRTALQETAEYKEGRDDIYGGWGIVDALGAVNYQSGCSINADCNDNNKCTTDVCNTTTGICSNTPVDDNTACTGGICCSGDCVAPICTESGGECDDGEDCTTDTCINAGVCLASCSNVWLACSLDSDGCCGSECNSETDIDCPTEDSCLNCFKGVCDGKCHPGKEGETCPDCQ